MKKYLVLGALFGLSFGAYAAETLPPMDKETFGKMVREYLLENPSVVMEAAELYTTETEKKKTATTQNTLKNEMDQIFSKDLLVLGNPDAKTHIAEFVDYNCGYCRKSHEVLGELLAKDKDLAIHIQPFPILAETSLETAKAVEATRLVAGNDIAMKLHNALYEATGAQSGENAIKLAVSFGTDEAKLREAYDGQEVKDALNASMKLAEMLNLAGTPAFVIGDQVYGGYMELNAMETIIADLRK